MEILFLILSKISMVGIAVSIISSIALVFSPIIGDSIRDDEKMPIFYKWIKRILVFLCVGILLAALPSIDDLWKVRIGLIKYQLASPENISKGVDEINRISKLLECKYIGCDDDKTESK